MKSTIRGKGRGRELMLALCSHNFIALLFFVLDNVRCFLYYIHTSYSNQFPRIQIFTVKNLIDNFHFLGNQSLWTGVENK